MEYSGTHGYGTRALVVMCLVALGFLAASTSAGTHGAPTTRASSRRAVQEKDVPANEELQGLLATLRDDEVRKNDPERLAAAIDRIKQLRSAEAVDDLAALIAFRRPEHRLPGGESRRSA